MGPHSWGSLDVIFVAVICLLIVSSIYQAATDYAGPPRGESGWRKWLPCPRCAECPTCSGVGRVPPE
jgi:hypothetical protein